MKKSKLSKKAKPPKFHHYVPKTYLKHWLDDKERVYIYNKKDHTVKPSSINGPYFGKNHLNTIIYPDGTRGYWVEKIFSELEGKITPVLNKIAASSVESSGGITYDDKLMLSMFLSAQFWRLPSNVDIVEERIRNGSFETIKASIMKPDGQKANKEEAEHFYKEISGTDLFRKVYPLLISLTSLIRDDTFDDLSSWSFYYQKPGFHLTSDNPILYMNQPSSDSIFKDFILPISPEVLLISNEKKPQDISAKMSNALNILQICHANQFVASNNEKYLRTVADLYKESFEQRSLSEVRQYVIGEIFKL